MSFYDDDGFYYDDYDDDHGPPDSPPGDSEADHVWADLARSEAEPPEDDAYRLGFVEIDFPDGTSARWTTAHTDAIAKLIEDQFGPPDTIKT